MPVKSERSKFWRIFWRAAGILFLLFIGAAAFVIYRVRKLPPELMQDIRAGIAARNLPDADQRFEKYLAGRYGPQTDPANRQKAFLDFFNPEHIRAMQLLVKHSPPSQRQANINASAKWVEHYRESLTPAERASLRERLQSPAGQAMLRQATAQYNQQDVYYRGETAPVISQLLTTIATVR